MAHTGPHLHLQDLKLDTGVHSQSPRADTAAQNGGRGADRTWAGLNHTVPGSQTEETDWAVQSGLAGFTFSKSEHISTPPIDVPHAGDDGAVIPETGSMSVNVSSLEDYIRNRRTSISFSPEVLLDTGRRQNMDEPLRKPNEHLRPRGRSLLHEMAEERPNIARANSESAREHYDPTTGELLQYDNHSYHPHERSTAGDKPRGETLSGDGTDPDRPTSLTSQSTASPVVDELRTPSDADQEFFGRLPERVSSPVQFPTSFEESSAWPPQRQRFSERSKTYTLGRSPSMRKAMRQSSGFSSRRSTASSGKSPAAMFLSQWSSPEEKPPQPDDQGQTIGDKYVIGKKIGYGGFSVVKEAMTIENGEERKVAVKIVKRNIAGRTEHENEQAQTEFDHEVDLWRCLNHPNVLPLEAVYKTNYATFCFTALKIGGTLFDLVKKNRTGIGMTLAQRYACQLAQALRYLHQDARVVHRDIKLENCLLDHSDEVSAKGGGSVVLCDFGMAEWLNAENRMGEPTRYEDEADRLPPRNIGPSETSTSIAGSLDYASPELLMSNGLVDPVVDIWAFGVCVYALIVGDRPFKNGFEPRLRMMIIKGEWREEMVLQGEGDEESRRDALDMLRNCMHMDVDKRWTIDEVLRCRWLKDCVPVESEGW